MSNTVCPDCGHALHTGKYCEQVECSSLPLGCASDPLIETETCESKNMALDEIVEQAEAMGSVSV